MTNKPEHIERPADENDVLSITSFGFFKGNERSDTLVEENVGECILCTNLAEGMSIPVEIDSKNIEEQGEEHGE